MIRSILEYPISDKTARNIASLFFSWIAVIEYDRHILGVPLLVFNIYNSALRLIPSLFCSSQIRYLKFIFSTILQVLHRKLREGEPLLEKCKEKIERAREWTSHESSANLFAEFTFYGNLYRNLAGAVETWFEHLKRVREGLSTFNAICQKMHASIAECENFLDSRPSSDSPAYRVSIIALYDKI